MNCAGCTVDCVLTGAAGGGGAGGADGTAGANWGPGFRICNQQNVNSVADRYNPFVHRHVKEDQQNHKFEVCLEQGRQSVRKPHLQNCPRWMEGMGLLSMKRTSTLSQRRGRAP